MIRFVTAFLFIALLCSQGLCDEPISINQVTIWAVEGIEYDMEIYFDFELTNYGLIHYRETFGYDFHRVKDESAFGVGYLVFKDGKKYLYKGVWTVGDLLEKIYPMESRKDLLLNPKLALSDDQFPL